MAKTPAQRAKEYREKLRREAMEGDVPPREASVSSDIAALVGAVRELVQVVTLLVMERSETVTSRDGFRDDRDGVRDGLSVTAGSRAPVPSSSHSLDVPKEKDREGEAREAPSRDAVTNRHEPSRPSVPETRPPPLPNGEYVRREDPLTPELIAIAELATVQDIKGAWLKFAGHNDGKFLPSIAGAWQRWCVREVMIERKDREEARAREQSGTRLRAAPDIRKPAPMSDERAKQLIESGGKG